MEPINFSAWVAQQRLLEAGDVVAIDDLIPIGKKVKRRRDGEQYQEFGITVAEFLTLSGGAVSSVFGRVGAVVALAGDYNTSLVPELGNLYFTNARAIAAPLTGYTPGPGIIAATDTILQAIQKLDGNMSSLPSGSGVLNYISKWTPDGATLGVSQIFDDGTSVGIGVSSGLKFSVLANTNGDWEASRFYSNNQAQYSQIGWGGMTSTYYLKFQSGTGQPLLLNPSGENVGIGTSSPTEKLDVRGNTSLGEKLLHLYSNDWATVGERERFSLSQGTFFVRANTYNLYASSDAGNAQMSLRGDNAIFEMFAPTFAATTFRITNSNKAVISAPNSSLIATTAFWSFDSTNSINASANVHIKAIDATSGNYAFKAENSASDALLYVRNDGNVAIGTSTPTNGTRLHVYRSVNDFLYEVKVENPTAGVSAASSILIQSDAGKLEFGQLSSIHTTYSGYGQLSDTFIRSGTGSRNMNFLTDPSNTGKFLFFSRLNPTTDAATPSLAIDGLKVGLGKLPSVATGLDIEGVIKTTQPSVNGAGEWKLGKVVVAASALDATAYLEVEIDGVIRKLALIS